MFLPLDGPVDPSSEPEQQQIVEWGLVVQHRTGTGESSRLSHTSDDWLTSRVTTAGSVLPLLGDGLFRRIWRRGASLDPRQQRFNRMRKRACGTAAETLPRSQVLIHEPTGRAPALPPVTSASCPARRCPRGASTVLSPTRARRRLLFMLESPEPLPLRSDVSLVLRRGDRRVPLVVVSNGDDTKSLLVPMSSPSGAPEALTNGGFTMTLELARARFRGDRPETYHRGEATVAFDLRERRRSCTSRIGSAATGRRWPTRRSTGTSRRRSSSRHA